MDINSLNDEIGNIRQTGNHEHKNNYKQDEDNGSKATPTTFSSRTNK